MSIQFEHRVIRKAEALAISGLSNTTIFEQTKNGEFPPPINVGTRAVAYFEREIQAVIAARAAGYSSEEIKELVSNLVEQRKKSANAFLEAVAA